MGQAVHSPGRSRVVTAAVAVDNAPQQYLTFTLGSEMFAVAILNVKEIIEYGTVTEIPMMPGFIRGVINLRGAVVPVIDLSCRFGGKSTQVARRTCIIIVEMTEGDIKQDIGVMVGAGHQPHPPELQYRTGQCRILGDPLHHRPCAWLGTWLARRGDAGQAPPAGPGSGHLCRPHRDRYRLRRS